MSPAGTATDRSVRRRLLTIAKVWIAVVAFLLVTMRLPSWLLVTMGVVAAATIVWLVTDVGQWVETTRWSTPSVSFRRARGQDGRLRQLDHDVHEMDNPNVGQGCRAALSMALLRVLDDRVDAAHGITRADDPQRYAAIVGPELTQFSNRPNPTLPRSPGAPWSRSSTESSNCDRRRSVGRHRRQLRRRSGPR